MTIKVILRGGIGNQLFQFFTGLSIAESSNRDLELNLSWYKNSKVSADPRIYELESIVDVSKILEDKFNILKFGLFDRFKNVISMSGFILSDDSFRKSNLANINRKFIYLDGYFQDIRFVEPVIRNLYDHIKIRNIDFGVELRMRELLDRHQVALHLRLGDYLSLENFHIISKSYIKECLSEIENRGSVKSVIVFTDSPEKAFQFLPLVDGVEFVIVSINDFTAPQTMILMSRFKNLILSNSTFSWWAGALASANGNFVFAPYSTCENSKKNFSHELFLSEWHAVSNL